MAENSAIGWTEATWNPWRGCTKISPGCTNCYMFTAQERYGRDPKQVVRTKLPEPYFPDPDQAAGAHRGPSADRLA